MCRQCYHSRGRYNKCATKCAHIDRPAYAKGVCKSCYINEYQKERRVAKNLTAAAFAEINEIEAPMQGTSKEVVPEDFFE